MILGPTSERPVGELTPQQVADAYPWPEDVLWVRAMMVTTLDGAAAGPDGLSGSISSGVDRVVFDAARRYADAVLVGAGTFRAEGYGPMRAKDADIERRVADGQAPAPILVIVSGSMNLDYDSLTFTRSSQRLIVITGSDADPERRARAEAVCEVIECPDADVPPRFILEQLRRRGLLRIVCEGGPSLLETLIVDDLLDEADISLSPIFAGTARTPRTSGLAQISSFELRHVLAAEGFLMNRYTAPGREAAR